MAYQAPSPLRYVAIFAFILPVLALRRTIGPPGDSRFIKASQVCNVTWPESFEFGVCSDTINCVYQNLAQALIASMSCGTSIAALLPTILALIGSPPLELVQLALVSPHRALATCCFSIGLPSGLFRQLRPLHSQLSNTDPLQPRIREWTVPLPAPSTKKWTNVVGKVVMDVIILVLAGIMLWRNWVVNSFTMIPWRCEYSFLLFCWPIACMMWAIIAVGLLHWMKESAEVLINNDPTRTYSIIQLMALPYRFGPNRFEQSRIELPPQRPHASQQNGFKSAGMSTIELTSSSNTLQQQSNQSELLTTTTNRSNTIATYGQDYVTVRITMHSNFGIRSWRCFEAIIECLAVGIYLYATFVLTSTLFLNADKAIEYATVMALCLSGVRILSVLF